MKYGLLVLSLLAIGYMSGFYTASDKGLISCVDGAITIQNINVDGLWNKAPINIQEDSCKK